MEPIRVSTKAAREKTASGEAKLVCAYEDEQRCKELRLEGSISLTEFNAAFKPSLSQDAEIIFYCA